MKMLSNFCLFGLLGLLAGCGHVFKNDFGSTGGKELAGQAAAVKTTESFAFEAESAVLVPGGTNTWQVTSVEGASGDQVVRNIGGGFYAEAQQGPAIVWTATLGLSTTYDIWGRVRPNPSGDSVFLEWDGESSEHHWGTGDHDQWVWTKLRTVQAEAAEVYKFTVWARENSIEIDLIVVQTTDAPEPVL